MKEQPNQKQRYFLACTGRTETEGFPEFLAQELGESRRNLSLLQQELGVALGVEHLTPVNSGSSANLIAALCVRELAGRRRKVLLAGFTFPTTVSAFSMAGFDLQLNWRMFHHAHPPERRIHSREGRAQARES